MTRVDVQIAQNHVNKLRTLLSMINRNCGYLDQMIGYAAMIKDPLAIDLPKLEELTIKLTRQLNKACNTVQWVIHDCCPELDIDPDACQQMMPREDGYDVMVDDTGLYVKTPLAPVSAYRAYAKSKKTNPIGDEKKRYDPMRIRLRMAPDPQITGPMHVYLLHTYNTRPKYRHAPDFDNYDTKSLLDMVMVGYGGDSPINIRMMVHATMLREDLDEGTYVAVRAYDPTRTVADLEEEALERFGTMRQRQEDNP
jgi:hypothetical protein